MRQEQVNARGVQAAISSVVDAVRRAVRHGIVMTEAMTETIIIEPLLAALGYAVWEYQKHGTLERVGNIPDYAILPKHPRQWFLEIKRWKIPLTEKDANQCVGYAFSRGSRWAVLTNGEEWRIFDAYSRAPLERKCVLTLPSLAHPEAVAILSLLAKEAMLADALLDAQRTRVIREAVNAELSDPNSATRRALRRAVEAMVTPPATPDELASALQDFQPTVLPDAVPLPQADAGYAVHERAADYLTEPGGGGEYSVAEFAARAPSPSRKAPAAVILPDNTTMPVATWRQVAVQVVAWCAGCHRLPSLPFSGMTIAQPSKYFLNSEPAHPGGRPGTSWERVATADGDIYLDRRHSARGFCRLLKALLLNVGIDPRCVRVRLK